MRHIEPLITPAEAVRLSLKAPYATICYSVEVANACVDYQQKQSYRRDAAFLIGCLWNAGRIQGIREERRARKEKKIAAAMHQKPIGRVPIGGGRTVPLFDLGPAYINTSEGWKLYGAYLDAKRAYENGKQAFEEAHK